MPQSIINSRQYFSFRKGCVLIPENSVTHTTVTVTKTLTVNKTGNHRNLDNNENFILLAQNLKRISRPVKIVVVQKLKINNYYSNKNPTKNRRRK